MPSRGRVSAAGHGFANTNMQRLFKTLLTLTLLATCVQGVNAAPMTNAFFAFCIDTHDARKRNLPEQAQMLKDLGYAGVGHLWLDRIAERLATLDAEGLRLFQITLQVDITPGKTPYDPRLKSVLPLLKGREVQFALLINGFKPSDPAGDDRAVEILREFGDAAAPVGAEILLYPHTANWVETVEDAFRVAEKVDRPNVNIMFNLCHWLRVSKDRDYKPLLKRVLPRLKAVSINGADTFDSEPGWARYIQPLGQGSFDVRELMRTLQQLGYVGPVGLQCYGIPGDARDHLAKSITAWRSYSR
jgi:sugar phosphate isomerase/epimerase